jgi:hypothetical protein
VKTISSSLQSFFLANTAFNRAYLISIVLPNGQVIYALDGTNITQITYPSGLPATVTVNGTGYPWLTTDPTYGFTGSGGSSPASLSMSPGQVLTLNYGSGTITSGSLSADASGTYGNPTSSYPGVFCIGPGTPPILGLIGGFANASGFLVSQPFFIGNNQTIGPAPIGTTQLLLGANDNSYSSNTGSWIINIISPTYYISKYGVWERGVYSNDASFSLSSSSMELTAYIPETIMYPGTTTPLMQVINQGVLSGSKVIIQSLYWALGSTPSSGFSMGTMQLMIGQIGNVKQAGRSKVMCEVFDLTYILNRPFPPHLIQSSCRHNFCDSGCTLLINNFRTTPYALDSSSTNLYLNFTIAARANTTGYVYGNLIVVSNVIYMCTAPGTSAGSPPSFNPTRGVTTIDGSVTWTSMGSVAAGTNPANQSFPLGYILGVTGQNVGFKRAIKAQVLSTGSLVQMQLLLPLPFPVAAGDTFRLFTGCDKTLGTCEVIYANQIHYGGMPFCPNPEVAA